MNFDDDEFNPFAGFGTGCDLHGEDYLRECTLCGSEFCGACFPHSALCPDCAAQGEYDDDEEEASEEEKDLLLLKDFNDDEPDFSEEEETSPSPAPPKRCKTARPGAEPKAKPKTGTRGPAKTAARAGTKTGPKTRSKATSKAAKSSGTASRSRNAPARKSAPRKRAR